MEARLNDTTPKFMSVVRGNLKASVVKSAPFVIIPNITVPLSGGGLSAAEVDERIDNSVTDNILSYITALDEGINQ